MDFTIEEVSNIIGVKELENLGLRKQVAGLQQLLDQEVPGWRDRYAPPQEVSKDTEEETA
jgi:hypothetical protein